MNKKGRPSSLERANCISKIFFWWLNPLLRVGYSKDLDLEDLDHVSAEDSSQRLADEFERQVAICKKNGNGISRAFRNALGWEYAICSFAVAFNDCILRTMQPLLMSWIIGYFSTGSSNMGKEFYACSLAFALIPALITTIHHPAFFGLGRAGMRARVAVMAAVYRKVLRLNQVSLSKISVGQVLNLLANDVARFDEIQRSLPYLFIGPIQLLFVVGLTWHILGLVTLVGAAIVILYTPVQGLMGRKLARYRLLTAECSDVRMRVLNEVVQGIKVIKMYAWESFFTATVGEARRNEIQEIRKTSYVKALFCGTYDISTRLLFTAVLVGVILERPGNFPPAADIFLTLALYNNLKQPMMKSFPQAVLDLNETRVALKRIQMLLFLEELEPAKLKNPNDTKETILKDAFVKYDPSIDVSTVRGLSFTVKPSELLAIIGPIGSGKTTILQAILGELKASDGLVSAPSSVSYAPQEPWLFSGSIRDNIIFGESFDGVRYERILNACCLKHDLDQLKGGDLTRVGERGAGLSGGQRARVGLARAVYRRADLYLLDDPLSAVDAKVAVHLYKDCIQDLAKRGSTVILVTHQVRLLKDADSILIINNGMKEAEGTYNTLMKTAGSGFVDCLKKEYEETEADDDNDGSEDMEELHKKDSSNSVQTMTEEAMFEGKCIEDNKEVTSAGSVSLSLYIKYFRSSGKSLGVVICLALGVLTQVIMTGSDLWLSFWINGEEQDSFPSELSYFLQFATKTQVSFAIYSIFIVTLVLLSMSAAIQLCRLAMAASTKLHENMFQSVLSSPMYFFDTQPAGRVLNRFSKDMGSVDEQLPPIIHEVAMFIFNVIGIVCIVVINKPLILMPTALIVVLFCFLRRIYLASSRSIKRIEGVSRSPVYSQVSSSLLGLKTIRASKQEKRLMEEFDELQDEHSSAFLTFLATTRWFGVCLDWTVVTYIFVVVLSFVFLDNGSLGGDVGIVLSSILLLTNMLQWGMRQSAVMETFMTSVERISEYTELPSEAPLKGSVKMQENWPHDGVIEFRQVGLSYVKGGPNVLKGLTFKTKPREKIGIVGRTGAGKSSIISALFRLTEPSEGQIILDGQSLLDMGLHEVRSNISIIPQEPVIFGNTVRENLDPFRDYEEKDIWKALEQVYLGETVRQMQGGLDTQMSEGGGTLSTGQKQLVCLARALLRKNKVLVLDEATANVDPKTDELVQMAIQKSFTDCTVLTIAHRLETVINTNRILVMEDGCAVEFDSPYNLLADPNSSLNLLVASMEEGEKSKLMSTALRAFEEQNEVTIWSCVGHADDEDQPTTSL